ENGIWPFNGPQDEPYKEPMIHWFFHGIELPKKVKNYLKPMSGLYNPLFDCIGHCF
ncbi:hypothetical protein HAX54_033596, partial [Datura stramonium]|nr:hypothetical protein [Datura stramonium]